MNSAEIKQVRDILQTFIGSEASEITLGEVAESLLAEVNEEGQLKNLPALKQAVLDYATVHAASSSEDD